jgi:hypothetical protein
MIFLCARTNAAPFHALPSHAPGRAPAPHRYRRIAVRRIPGNQTLLLAPILSNTFRASSGTPARRTCSKHYIATSSPLYGKATKWAWSCCLPRRRPRSLAAVLAKEARMKWSGRSGSGESMRRRAAGRAQFEQSCCFVPRLGRAKRIRPGRHPRLGCCLAGPNHRRPGRGPSKSVAEFLLGCTISIS